LTICYAEHQHNDQIGLTGEIFFPNLYLETTILDFGCILNNTENYQDLKITNIGPLVVNYKWKFVLEKDNVTSNLNQDIVKQHQDLNEDEVQLLDMIRTNQHRVTSESNLESGDHHLVTNIIGDPLIDMTLNSDKLDQIEHEILSEKKQASEQLDQDNFNSNKMVDLLKKAPLQLPNIEEIFDISPLYGCLHPGEVQKMRITYFGHKEVKAYVRAVCEVSNGPSYELMLKGEASVLNYEISSHDINFDYIVSINKA